MQATASTLAHAPRGVDLMLIAADTPPALRRRLAELGLRVGCQLSVVSHTAGGGRIVSVAGSRVALDKETARRLTVTPGTARTDSTPGDRHPAGAGTGSGT